MPKICQKYDQNFSELSTVHTAQPNGRVGLGWTGAQLITEGKVKWDHKSTPHVFPSTQLGRTGQGWTGLGLCNMSKIFLKYVQYMLKICQNYAQVIPKICPSIIYSVISLGLSIGLNLIVGLGLAGFSFLDWIMFLFLWKINLLLLCLYLCCCFWLVP